MTNRKTICKSRKATESKIEEIEKQVKKMSHIPDSVMSYTDALGIMRNLQELKRMLESDIKRFDEIEIAMEEAVK